MSRYTLLTIFVQIFVRAPERLNAQLFAIRRRRRPSRFFFRVHALSPVTLLPRFFLQVHAPPLLGGLLSTALPQYRRWVHVCPAVLPPPQVRFRQFLLPCLPLPFLRIPQAWLHHHPHLA